MTLCPPSHNLFCTASLQDLGEPDKKANMSERFLVPHVTKLLPGTRSVHVCVCLSFGPDLELVTLQYWFATLMLTICQACLHTFRQSVLAPVNMKLELLFWFCGQKTLIVRLSTDKSWIGWEALEKLLKNFSHGFYSVVTMDFAVAMSPILLVS